MTNYDEEHLAELIRLLRPAPAGWVQAAKELPAARQQLDVLVHRAEADAAYRKVLLADLEQAMLEVGIEPRRHVVDHLRRRLAS